MEKMNVERFKRAVFNLLQTSYIENWDFVQKLDINYDKELDKFFLNVTFKDGLNKKEKFKVFTRENFLKMATTNTITKLENIISLIINS